MSDNRNRRDRLAVFLMTLVILYWVPRVIIYLVRRRRRRNTTSTNETDPSQGLPNHDRQRSSSEILKQQNERKELVLKSVLVKVSNVALVVV